ncbi:MAG: hypothetical protein HY260_01960 [Chloroflexi bacterium]|nr:hypothetical protein [Chloroflexota bacterium]
MNDEPVCVAPPCASLSVEIRQSDNQTTVLLFDLVVQSADDHPGGGYEMHIVSVTHP